MTDFSNHTNDELAEDLMAALLEAEARADAQTPSTSHLSELKLRLSKAHLQLALALVAANDGGYASFSGGDPKP